MKLKGETLIQLTNVKTGEVEEYRHENFVTEFASEYFKECGALNSNPLGSIQDSMPVDDLFGGIMLFDKKINQNSDDAGNHPHPLYCPAGTKMVANGSINIDRNSNATELGQYDATESGTPNEHQRVYVYNWDTDEGNGKINCVCLTTREGGYIGAGNATSGVQDTTGYLQSTLFKYKGTPQTGRTFTDAQKLRLAGLDLGQSQVMMLSTTPALCFTNGSAVINRYDIAVSKLNPFVNKKAFDESLLTPKSSSTHVITQRSNVAYARVMGGKGYVLLIGSSSSSIQNGTVLYASQIDKDGTVTNKQYTISNWTTSSFSLNSEEYVCGKIVDNDLYFMYSYGGYNRTVRIKASGETEAIISNATWGGFKMSFAQGRIYVGGGYYYDTVSHELYISNVCDMTSSTYERGVNRVWQCYDCNLFFYVPIGSAYTEGTPLAVVRPMCNWLSTINNLQNEVEKTADKTMKVTYTLTLT